MMQSVDRINLDFEQARAKHLLFKTRLRSILYGAEIDEAPVISQHECTVGKWIYGHALADYSHIVEMRDLEKVHAELHIKAKQIVEKYRKGNIEESRSELDEIEIIAARLIDLLTTIEKKVKKEPEKIKSPISVNDELSVNLHELYELQKLNEDLYRRIRRSEEKIRQSEANLQMKVKERTEDLEQQKKFISSILDASFNGIYSLKAVRNEEGEIIDFQYLFANNITLKLLGLNANDIIGKNMLEVIPENKANGFFDLFIDILKKGNSVKDETYYEFHDLKYWFDYAIVPIDSDILVVTLQDITDHKNTLIQSEEQRKLLDSILQHSPSGITVYKAIRDEEGKVKDLQCIVANEVAEKFTEISNKDRLTKTVCELTPAISNSPLFEKAVAPLNTGELFQTQYFHEPIKKWLELSVAKMDDDHLINLFADITFRKEAQIEIENAAERLQAVFIASQSGMFTFAPVRDDNGEVIDFRFIITNPSFASYVGQTPEVLNGELGSKWFPGYFTNGVFEMYKKTYLTNEMQRRDIHYNVDGHDIYLDLQSTKVGDEVLVTFTDYTALKKAQLQLEKYIEELKRTNINLEEFAYAASHDLKEPIRKIHFFSERIKVMMKERMSDEEHRYFERIEKASKRMSNLIDDLLAYSMVTLKDKDFEEVDMNQLIDQVLDDLDLEIEEKEAKITVDKLFTLQGHHRQLQQAFQNIIGNALKYSKPGTPPQIKITAEKTHAKDTGLILPVAEQNQVYNIISIQDNGIGFEQQDAERIFKMFTRLHGSTEYRGTGIGLSIARKVAENHNGFIIAESEPQKGSIFKVYLPE
jgi:signal transduction histidine kinase